MPTVTVDESKIGQIVATDGKLIGITLKTVPTSYGNDYLSLVDGYYVPDADSNPVLVQELPMFNMHIASSPVSVDSVLMANGRDLFSNLTVKNCPPGCTFDIEYGTPPPPPTLTALNPDTAVSGDIDFVLYCEGSDFTDHTVINFAGQEEPTTFMDGTRVTTIVKPSLFAPAVIPVYVHDGPRISTTLDFTFTAPAGAEE